MSSSRRVRRRLTFSPFQGFEAELQGQPKPEGTGTSTVSASVISTEASPGAASKGNFTSYVSAVPGCFLKLFVA